MKTNREKYDHICDQIKARNSAAIRELLPDGVPEQFYAINGYSANPVAVTEVRRHMPGFYVKPADSRIMTKDIDDATAALEAWVKPTLDDIMVHYSEKKTYGNISGAYPYPKIGSDAGMAWTAEALAPEIERRRALYAEREGHDPCTYCRKQTPSGSMVSRTIYYRNRGGLAQKTCRYCSPACGGYDQMGHEG